ncbi:glycine cleavage system protein T [Komagataeibacter nataicola]|uniref:aminomethyltransferase n=1 Tax=Komagataeibacter nataicola TaxID=265960 RepID=A0A9N7CI78_9PROT|nr:glycine cleavage system aminomethyltransferase GcvT [Komagataeibacter nataicola]AQU88115.1 glycine cleavage system protein T [Komagataeibacter nataicola]PYD66897.1 glycine cleavage system aminomethyltransferase T [Komagataeibacter nataicola]WEQ54789.1 glycine cleavage system aminomethyltransferase GcvT [Komagataeibacter nataicola]WNM09137.1 glycine cleavage system aminomethyltransferase GcvT [Komagataeibacter nataicola]GBR20448.1 glycine cleavage system protein T [Komagataeibacter nataicola
MTQPLLRTPLYDLHIKLGARMVPFAGYDMPVQYPAGVMAEHLHTRGKAGLFDVSHMGQVRIRPRSGNLVDAAHALEALVPADIVALRPGRQRYAVFTTADGGISDDLMVTNMSDWLLLVVNAACKEADFAHVHKALNETCTVERLDGRALIALQGPAAEAALAALNPAAAAMRFMDVAEMDLAGVPCIVSRSGYTGEDGYEIGMANEGAETVARALLAQPDVAPAGLGARDSLRLEAGLCLYGADIDLTTTPVEGALEWSIQKSRRPGGARAGGYPGAQVVADQLADGTTRRRVGLRAEGRAPVRGGAELFADEAGQVPAGHVTSGAFGPSVGGPVAMGYVAADHAAVGTRLFASVRGRLLPVAVVGLPFVAATFRR